MCVCVCVCVRVRVCVRARAQDAEFINFRAGGTYSKHRALKCFQPE